MLRAPLNTGLYVTQSFYVVTWVWQVVLSVCYHITKRKPATNFWMDVVLMLSLWVSMALTREIYHTCFLTTKLCM